MRKKAWTAILSLLALLLFFSCNTSTETTGTVRLYVGSSNTRTIRPSTFTAPQSYRITLTPSEGEAVEKTFNQTSGTIEIEEVRMGTYTVLVEGYEEEDCQGMMTCVSSSSTPTLTVKPAGDNSIIVPMEAIYTDGTGSLEVTFNWDGLTNSDTPFADALEKGELNFQLLYISDDGEATEAGELKTIEVSDGITECTLTYSGLAATTGQTIAFTITDKDGIAVAYKKFSNTLQIAAGQVSKPDSNDEDLYLITDDNVPSYIGRNISNVSWSNVEGDPHAIKITWSNPKKTYNTTMISKVTLVLSDGESQITKEIDINETDMASSCIFTGLEDDTTYTLNAQAFLTDGRASSMTEFFDSIHTKISVKTISLISDNLPDETLTYGSSFTLSYEIGPGAASDKSVTWSLSNPDVLTVVSSEDQMEAAFTANKPGSTKITVTSNDNAECSATTAKDVKVKLAAPAASAEAGDGEAIVSWNEIPFADSYDLYRKTTENFELIQSGITGTSYSDSAILSDTTYCYAVKAKMNEGEDYASDLGSASNGIEIKPVGFVVLEPTFDNVSFSIGGSNYITVTNSNPVTVEFDNTIGAADFKWYINSALQEEANGQTSITIDINNEDLDFYDTVQTLMLSVAKDGKWYSDTITFSISGLKAFWLNQNGTRLSTGILETGLALADGELGKFGISVLATDTELSFEASNDVVRISDGGIVTIDKTGDTVITISDSKNNSVEIDFSFYTSSFSTGEELLNKVNQKLGEVISKADASFEHDWWINNGWAGSSPEDSYTVDGITIRRKTNSISASYPQSENYISISNCELEDGTVLNTTANIQLNIEGGSGSNLDENHLYTIGYDGNGTIEATLPGNQGKATIRYENINVGTSDRSGSYYLSFTKPVGPDASGENATINETTEYKIDDSESIIRLLNNN